MSTVTPRLTHLLDQLEATLVHFEARMDLIDRADARCTELTEESLRLGLWLNPLRIRERRDARKLATRAHQLYMANRFEEVIDL